MALTAIRRFFDLGSETILDHWLRLVPSVQARYDAEHGERRTAELRSAILVGLAIYNVCNVTSIALLPDVLAISIALRIGLVTPVSLGLIWLIGRTTPIWTERLVMLGVLNAYLIPVFLFWATREPLGLFTFGELSLVVIFANMLLTLRFPHAVVFTAGALVVTLLAIGTKEGLQPPLQFAFTVQTVMACIFSLYANYLHEKRRSLDYLTALDAKLNAQSADAARREFQDLSRTDALTTLPNRRHLAERLGEWLPTSSAMALMMIDIDHFKLYNDALGHPAGDDCLRRVAKAFALIANREDGAFCARFGGEEFTFVLRDATEMDAARCAKALLQAVAALEISHPTRADGVGRLTISIGIARRPNGKTCLPDELLTAADRALYAAKRRGRNCFVLNEGVTDLARTN